MVFQAGGGPMQVKQGGSDGEDGEKEGNSGGGKDGKE